MRARGRKGSPVSPGEILQEEFLRPLGISQYRLAKALTVPPRRINDQWRVCFRWKDLEGPGRTVTRRMSRSSTITRPSARARRRKVPPVSPGEILQEEFLRPLGISQYRLAKALTVPPRRIDEIVHGKRAGLRREVQVLVPAGHER